MAWHPLRGQPGTGKMGVVYLLAFDKPVGHAFHYRGWGPGQPARWRIGARNGDPDLPGRLAAHSNGTGARLVQVAKQRGIGWTLVAAVEGDRHEERRLKNLMTARATEEG